MKLSKSKAFDQDLFAQEWVEAWNSHDLEKILSHYDDDFVMHSPVIAQLLSKPDGCLIGKDNVKVYWQKALEMYPELTFKIDSIFSGAMSTTIVYEGVQGKVAEVFKFNHSGKVYEASAHYMR